MHSLLCIVMLRGVLYVAWEIIVSYPRADKSKLLSFHNEWKCWGPGVDGVVKYTALVYEYLFKS